MSKEGGLPVRWEAKWIDPELVHAPEERQPLSPVTDFMWQESTGRASERLS